MKTKVWFALSALLVLDVAWIGLESLRADCGCPDYTCDELFDWYNDGTGAPYGYAFDARHAFRQVYSTFPLGGVVHEPSPVADSVDRYDDCDIDIACALAGQPDAIKWYE